MCIWYDMKYIKMIYMWMNNMMSDVTGLWALYNNRMSLILSKLLRRATHLHSIPRGVTANGLRAVLRTLHRPKDPP